ncbi:MAG: ABC transporter ATP-binding protein [Lachnospiraceae bacterium]|jgi:ABC-type antimicrobial peptide transport system, ATPase component|nr:ABC transporter ATP-binding protein [Lachnospiraceae bacterium]RKI22381.1 ABC transporter ATP-binding protein [bacterium D16-36]RKI64147.1 ABC transporter ATP-binding protein [bacterium 1xD8-6]
MFIRLENITKTYGKKDGKVEALKGITMDLKEGEMVAVMGKSGSGKSTLLNILGGLTMPTSGQYFFKGQDMALLKQKQMSKFRQKSVGFVVQYFALIDDMDVYHNIALALRHSGISGKESRRRIMEAAESLGISEKLKSFPDELSGGQKQRVAIARAIVKDSDMIAADEPTGALDSQTAEELMKVFRDINEKGKTMLIVTHDMEIAKKCDRIIEISDGQLSGENI